MKKLKQGLWPISIMAMLLIAGLGCKKNIQPADNSGGGTGEIVSKDGISDTDLATYGGDIGIVIDARTVQKKGYKPKTLKVTVKANSGNFSKTIDLNPYTLMGQIKLPADSLSTEAQSELKQGVAVVAQVLDASGSKIWEESFSKISFQSNPSTIPITANGLKDLDTEVHLNAGTPYYIQIVNKDGTPSATAVSSSTQMTVGYFNRQYLTYPNGGAKFTGDEKSFLYTFQAIPNTTNTFAIKSIVTNKYLRIKRGHLYPISYSLLQKLSVVIADLDWTFPGDFINGNTDARFMVKKTGDGVYQLQSVQGEKIMFGKFPDNLDYLMINDNNNSQAKDIYFRFVPMNIDWSVESIETQYLDPILPAARNGFSFNSTLVNCGAGQLTQTVGNSKTVETVTTVGWKESISTMSSHKSSASLKLGLEVSGSFFGNGATYSAEVTGSYEYTTASTTETQNWNEATGSTSETFFSQREVTVPPKTASLVYDAYQSYDNIKVNLVQRLRVRATDFNTGKKLSGDEIASQFHFNGFNGVITEIGADYIEVTLRGVATMDKVFKSKSDVQSVPSNCGG